MKGLLNKLFKLFAITTGILIVLLAVLLNGSRLLINLLPDKNQLVSAVATEWLHQPVTIKSLHLSGSVIHPLFSLTGVTLQAVADRNVQPIQFEHLSVGLDLWHSFYEWKWITDHLSVDGLHFSNQENESEQRDYAQLLNWALAQPAVTFRHMMFTWQGNGSTVLKVQQIDLLMKNQGSQHVLAGHLIVPHKTPTQSRFVLRLHAQNWQDTKMHGLLYIYGHAVVLPEWLSALSAAFHTHFKVTDGVANFQVWGHVSHRALHSVQMNAEISALSLKNKNKMVKIGPLRFNGLCFTSPQPIGVIHFQSDKFGATLPMLFSHSMSHWRTSGQLEWMRQGRQWLLHLSHFNLADKHLNFSTQALLKWQADKKPRLRVQGRLHFGDLGKVSEYLPDRVLTPGLLHWLDKGLVHGQLSNAQFLFQGSPNDFPFDHHDGHFEVSANLKRVTLNYQKDWPPLRQFNGRLIFDNRGMRITAKNAEVASNPIQVVNATIDNLTHPDLHVCAESQTSLAKALAFLKHSQLGIAKDMALFQGSGPVHAKLQLHIPLFHGHGKPSAQGEVHFLDDHILLPKWQLSLDKISGSLHFLNNRLFGKKLRVLLFEQPFSLQLNTHRPKNAAPNLQITADGRLLVGRLIKQFKPSLRRYVDGHAMLHVELLLHDVQSTQKNQVTILSDLQGLRVTRVPPPFSKLTSQEWPSRLQVVIPNTAPLYITGALGDVLSTALLVQRNHSGIRFLKGRVVFGSQQATLPKHDGLFVDGDVPEVNLTLWQQFLKQVRPVGVKAVSSYRLPSFLKQVELTVGQLLVADQKWQDLLVLIKPVSKGVALSLQNDHVSGKVILPREGQQPIRARLAYLFLHSNKKKKSVQTMRPESFPSLDVQIADFRLNKKLDGRVALVTKAVPNGLLIKQLKAKSGLFDLSIKGVWLHQHDAYYTRLVGDFDSQDFGALLARRHISSRLKGGLLTTHFKLAWPGSPDQFAFVKTEGKLLVHLSKGRILQLNTETESNLEIGRLLNLLSLESLSEYLTFDFSPLTKKGFPFHTIEGEFDLDKGKVVTHNADIDGPLANIHVKGMIGLSHKNNDLILTIAPYVSSSLPMIVGIAGGPIAGVTAWVANKVLAPGIGHLIQMSYHVGGTWRHPVIKKIKR